MKIVILHGGSIRAFNSLQNARAIYADFVKKGKTSDVTMYEVDTEGNLLQAGVKTSVHAVFPLIDHVIDTTFLHKFKTEYKNLAHKLGVAMHLSTEIDNYNHRKILNQIDIDHPSHYVIKSSDENKSYMLHEMWRKMHMPIIIKSPKKFTSSLVTYNPQEALEYIIGIHARGDDAVIDEYSRHKVYTIFTIKRYRGEHIYTTPVVELFKSKNLTASKSKYIQASMLSDSNKKSLYNAAKSVALHIDDSIVRVNLSVDKAGNIKVLHTSTKPDYHEGQIMYGVFGDYGINFADILN